MASLFCVEYFLGRDECLESGSGERGTMAGPGWCQVKSAAKPPSLSTGPASLAWILVTDKS